MRMAVKMFGLLHSLQMLIYQFLIGVVTYFLLDHHMPSELVSLLSP